MDAMRRYFCGLKLIDLYFFLHFDDSGVESTKTHTPDYILSEARYSPPTELLDPFAHYGKSSASACLPACLPARPPPPRIGYHG